MDAAMEESSAICYNMRVCAGLSIRKETHMSNKRRDSKGRILRNGESQRKDGRYVFNYKDIDGKNRSIYSTRLEPKDKLPDGARPAPALRELEDQILRNQSNGIANFGGDLTVLELVERYIETRADVRETTRTNYRTVLNHLKQDPFSTVRIDKVRLSDAKLWLVKLQKSGMHYSSIQNIRGVLRPAFRMAFEDELISRNPFDFELGSVVENDSKQREALSPEWEERILRFIQEDQHFCHYYDAIFILLNTGLRISEFCGLTPEDVDFDRRCIHVRGQLIRYSNMGKSYEPTKTSSGLRDVPMSEEVMQCFRNIIANRPVPCIEPEIDGKSGFFFLDQNGMPMVAMHWQHYFQHIRAKYNAHYKEPMPEFSPHVCRHTFSTKMARKGMNAKNLQYIMGHSEISVTLDTYTHLGFQDARKDFERIMGA